MELAEREVVRREWSRGVGHQSLWTKVVFLHSKAPAVPYILVQLLIGHITDC